VIAVLYVRFDLFSFFLQICGN